MRNNSSSQVNQKKASRFLELLRGSIIISALDRLCILIYELLGSGLFAKIFSSGSARGKATDVMHCGRENVFSRLRSKLSRILDSSHVVRYVTEMAEQAVYCRLKVIGLYLITFASVSCVLALLSIVFDGTVASRFDAYIRLTEGITFAGASLFFLCSKKNLSEVIAGSRICKWVINSCGFTVKSPRSEGGGSLAAAFILGTVCGLASFFVYPLYILGVILGAMCIYVVLSTPEFGVVCLFFLMPFAPTMVLAGIVLFVSFSFAVKLIRGKRVLSLKRIDFFTVIFAFLIISSGFVSLSTGSIAPSVIFTVFILAYFLVSCCMQSPQWLSRCTVALMFSALIVSFYGIFQYVFGSTMTGAWIDADLFEGISGRAVATLENPNMLGEYLILIIPIAAAMWMGGYGVKRKTSFVAFACMAMCLILTWSRGAWIGFILAFMILLLIWNRRSVWIIVCGIISLPFLPFVLPDSIISRITSIGNLADSSTSYRVSIWRAAMHMIEDHLLSGIGIGEKAWGVIYPDYTLPGIEAAPHSHNLFMQITLESGLFALVMFAIILFLLIRYSFSSFSSLSEKIGFGMEKRDALQHKLQIAGPLCGLIAVLIQGLTDYSWYNYRVYLMFWLVLGMIPAFVKNSETVIRNIDAHKPALSENNADLDLMLPGQTKKHAEVRKESKND